MESAASSSSPADLIDLRRYPIIDSNIDAARALTRHCREQLDRTGACELPGFLTAAAVELLTREGDELSALAYHSESTGTPYLEIPDRNLPEDHPRRIFDHTSVGVVAYDQFPPDCAMRRLYEWEPLMDFICATLGQNQEPAIRPRRSIAQVLGESEWDGHRRDRVHSLTDDADCGLMKNRRSMG
jgi:hypothetical protein